MRWIEKIVYEMDSANDGCRIAESCSKFTFLRKGKIPIQNIKTMTRPPDPDLSKTLDWKSK